MSFNNPAKKSHITKPISPEILKLDYLKPILYHLRSMKRTGKGTTYGSCGLLTDTCG